MGEGGKKDVSPSPPPLSVAKRKRRRGQPTRVSLPGTDGVTMPKRKSYVQFGSSPPRVVM